MNKNNISGAQKPAVQFPYCEDTEAAVVAAALCDSGKIHVIAAKISDSDFYVPALQKLWRGIVGAHNAGLIADELTLAELVAGGLESVGGCERIASLISIYGGTSAEALESHCAVLLDLADRRRLIVACENAAHAARSGPWAADAVAQLAADLTSIHRDARGIASMQEMLGEAIAFFEMAMTDGAKLKKAAPTGIAVLDGALTYGGIPRGLVATIGAESSKGKSALAASIVRGAAGLGQKCLIVSLEDSQLSVVLRMTSQASGIENRKIQGGKIWTDDMPAIERACASLWNYDVDFLDTPPPGGVDAMMSQIQALNAKKQYDLIVLDYLQLIPSGRYAGNTQERTDYVFQAINAAARRMPNAATLLVSQLRRIDGRPRITNMYHSGMIEQASRTVILIWDPPELRPFSARVLDVAKQHNGATGQVIVGWRPESVLYHHLEPTQEMVDALRRAVESADDGGKKRSSR